MKAQAAQSQRAGEAVATKAAPAPDPWADARTAALLLAVCPQGLGGARLRGGADERRDHWLQLLRSACPAGAPWLRLPLHTDDDRLLGGLDLGATLQRGSVVLQPGLLARCQGGVLLAAMAERMSPAMAARLAATLDTGSLPVPQPLAGAPTLARFAVVALDEGQTDDDAGADAARDGAAEAPPSSLLDRLGLQLDLGRLPRPAIDDGPLDQAAWAQAATQARQRLPAVRCSDEIVQALCEAAWSLGVFSMRASQFAVSAARAHAACAGRSHVAVEDAAVAARLVLAPRATRLPAPPEDMAPDEATDVPPDLPPAEVPPADQSPANAENDQSPEPPPQAESDQAPDPAATAPPQDQLLQAALAAVPSGLLAMLASAAGRGPAGAGGRAGALQASKLRGRPYGSRRGDPRSGARLHLIATLRAAAPWQVVRRRAQPAGAPVGPLVLVQREDFHISRFRQRRETTTLFVVDASGSAALHRLAEAKGAVELLLADCYVRRDRVALLAFRGQAGAELLLPPTRSLVRAKRSLAAMVGGGGTPLAAALDAARELTLNITRQGGTPLAVFLTDGRANIARDGSPGRERAHADALAAARLWRAAGLGALWLDTAPQPQPPAQQIALAMGARYLPLPHADAQQMQRAVTALR